ncbi:MAG: hypothetical protein GX149_01045 [Acholeplasmataceae bacterium]|jgi:hypothetical protein|nr:hypothetical protein [Acholeplasmataceae bacterium]
MKRLIRKFKQPLAKPELKRFLIEGFLGAVVFGSLLGALDYLIIYTKLQFLSFFTFLIFYIFITRRLYRSFNFYHIAYSFLAVFFVLLGDYFITVSHQIILSVHLFGRIFVAVFNPINQFRFLFSWSLNPLAIMTNILNIVIYIIVCVFTYQNMKR